MKKVHLERLFSLMLMALSVSVYIQALSLTELKTNLLTGPAFFPKWLAVALFICSALPLLKTFIRPVEKNKTEVSVSSQSMLLLAFFIAVLGGTLLVIPYIGWYPSQLALVLILELTLEKRKIIPACLVSIIAAVVIYLIFEVGLHIPFPVGSFFE